MASLAIIGSSLAEIAGTVPADHPTERPVAVLRDSAYVAAPAPERICWDVRGLQSAARRFYPDIKELDTIYFDGAFRDGTPNRLVVDGKNVRVTVAGLEPLQRSEDWWNLMPEAHFFIENRDTSNPIRGLSVAIDSAGVMNFFEERVAVLSPKARSEHRLLYNNSPWGQPGPEMERNRPLQLRIFYDLKGEHYEEYLPIGYAWFIGWRMRGDEIVKLALLEAPFLDEVAAGIQKTVADSPVSIDPRLEEFRTRFAKAREVFRWMDQFGLQSRVRLPMGGRVVLNERALMADGENFVPVDDNMTPMEMLYFQSGACRDLSPLYLALLHRLKIPGGLVFLPWSHVFPIVEVGSEDLWDQLPPDIQSRIIRFPGDPHLYIAPEVTKVGRGTTDFITDVLRSNETVFEGGWGGRLPKYRRYMLDPKAKPPARRSWLETAPIRLIPNRPR